MMQPFPITSDASIARRQWVGVRKHSSRVAFTLVELLVTMVIIAILAALSLAGLVGIRDRSKADKTRSTIRKLHEIIMPQYESYLTRRVKAGSPTSVWPTSRWSDGQYLSGTMVPPAPVAASAVPATNRLWGLRVLMSLEMPDQWEDVATKLRVPSWAVTSPVKRYGSMPTKVNNKAYASAECLAMIVMRSGFNTDLIETFRADEIGNVDGDSLPEILDGWGKPIGFIRWPVGFDSPLLQKDAQANPDPFDPMRRSQEVAYPGPLQTDYGVVPLIFSCGPDGATAIPVVEGSGTTPNYGGYANAEVAGSALTILGLSTNPTTVAAIVPSNRTATSGTRPGATVDVDAVRDNITNFNLK